LGFKRFLGFMIIFTHHFLNMPKLFPLLFILSLALACKDSTQAPENSPAAPDPAAGNEPLAITYTVMNALPHDKESYTEGFLVHDGKLYESSGAPQGVDKTRSVVGIVNPVTGKLEVKTELDKKKYFGEGIAIIGNRLYQITWKNEEGLIKKGFIYDLKTFKKIGEFDFPSKEGWGMTTDGKSLIMSDGSSNITYLDPVTFKTNRIVGVTDNNGAVGNINELEYVNGNILANIYETPYIIRIDANTGKVLGKADFSSLVKELTSKDTDAEYMNGIAYDSAKNKLYITGKLWPNIYEVRFNN
jgi:glutaminyl-peptide cyclotransferase